MSLALPALVLIPAMHASIALATASLDSPMHAPSTNSTIPLKLSVRATTALHANKSQLTMWAASAVGTVLLESSMGTRAALLAFGL